MSWKRKPKPVEVDWIDSAFTAGWHNLRKVRTLPSDCKTFGYLVEKTKTHIVVAMNVSDSGAAGELMTIPRTCVKAIRRVR